MIVVLNNKCNLLTDEFIKYQGKLADIKSSHTLVLCPSSLYLTKFYLDNFYLGSQNVSSYYEGAYTGEVAASQLQSIGVKYCIVGHSERRRYQKETSEEIKQKIEMLLDNGITPILCVGENQNEKEANMTVVKVLNQIKDSLTDVDGYEKVIIAYEPIWAIGTGKTPTCEEIDNVLMKVKDDYPQNSLLYGGSVSEKNIEELNQSTYIEGYLLGESGLKVDQLKELLSKLEN